MLSFPLKLVAKYLPKRNSKDHKGMGGKCVVIAGSKGMRGAAILTAKAALKVGSGYVTLFTDRPDEIALENPDFLTMSLNAIEEGMYEDSTIALGPGLGQTPSAIKIVKKIMGHPKLTMDADALSILARIKNPKLHPATILTPHAGELAKLINWKPEKINQNREKAAKEAAKKYQCLVLLKGNKTIVASPSRAVQIQSGNVALAKAGSGDVLTGIIAGLRAQNLTPWQAALIGATLHGYIADEYVKSGNDYLTLTASLQITLLGPAISNLRNEI